MMHVTWFSKAFKYSIIVHFINSGHLWLHYFASIYKDVWVLKKQDHVEKNYDMCFSKIRWIMASLRVLVCDFCILGLRWLHDVFFQKWMNGSIYLYMKGLINSESHLELIVSLLCLSLPLLSIPPSYNK